MAPRVAKLPANVVFNGTAGDSRKLDATFRASLLGEGPLAVDPAHWILAVLPSLTPVAITMRLLIFVFLPAFVFADDLDQEVGSILFYPAPLSLSRLLHRLVKEGISAEPVPDARALQGEHRRAAATLPDMLRTVKRLRTVAGVPRLHCLSETPYVPLSSLALVAELVATIQRSLALTHEGAQALATVLFNDEGMRMQSIKAASKQRSTAVGRELGDEGDTPTS
ncbi:hypothetical protein AB1Y20_016019 [Prymnesium parvum]|uniref:Uncharacterized protein n=1 Tax=Prymnesium parvum TaxID=97485 RepID=A0AB34K4P7_PRYPA